MKRTLLMCLLVLSMAIATVPSALADENSSPTDNEYAYDSIDPDGDVTLHTELLSSVVNMETALNAVRQQILGMDAEDKESSANIDLTTLFAETAISDAARKQVSGREIVISKTTVGSLETTAQETNVSLGQVLEDGGIEVARDIANTVTFLSDETGQITIRIEPNILETKVDKVRVETPTYALTFKLADLKEDLKQTVVITAEDIGTEYEVGTTNRIPSVNITMPDGYLSNPITISLPTGSAEPTFMAVLNAEGDASSSKYNPATASLDGKVNTSGKYTPVNNAKNFTDISGKDARMQKAIRELSARGIINGTSETTFSPDSPLTRAHFVTLVMRGLGKIDSNARADFRDVNTSHYYYAAVASSKQRKIIEGYADGCFHGDWLLNKRQIYTVTGRILVSEMGYRKPSDLDRYLNKFTDTVAENDNMKEMIALSTQEDLVVMRKDGAFSGASTMTRGNAAVILYSLFQKIW